MVKLKYLVPLALLLTITVNYLATALPINGVTTGQVSDSLPTMFAPAGYVFAIWGVIYLLLVWFCIYQFNIRQKNLHLDNIRAWFVINCVLNAVWIVLWHYGWVLQSLGIMIVLLINLIMIYQEIDLMRKKGNWVWGLKLPFSVYLSWICVATIANAATWLVSVGWDGAGISETVWTVLMIGVATLLNVVFLRKNQDLGFMVVFLWAIVGIAVKNSNETIIVSTVFLVVIGMVFLAIKSLPMKKSNNLFYAK
jgi:hypothetical protein